MLGEGIGGLLRPNSGLDRIWSKVTPSASSALASFFSRAMPSPVSGRFESSGAPRHVQAIRV
jgi:hypothetical protein